VQRCTFDHQEGGLLGIRNPPPVIFAKLSFQQPAQASQTESYTVNYNPQLPLQQGRAGEPENDCLRIHARNVSSLSFSEAEFKKDHQWQLFLPNRPQIRIVHRS